MPEHPQDPHGGAIVNPQTKHETSDVNVKALLNAVVIFIVFAIVTHIVLYLMFGYYRTIFKGETNAPLTMIKPSADALLPPEPRLQPLQVKNNKGIEMPPGASTPVTDLENMRRAEEEAQNNPAWIDQGQGRVRLPIEVAKQLLVQRGLPVNSGTPPPATTTTTSAPLTKLGAAESPSPLGEGRGEGSALAVRRGQHSPAIVQGAKP
jgi:hypothetical protein